jgi:hypothetical protein
MDSKLRQAIRDGNTQAVEKSKLRLGYYPWTERQRNAAKAVLSTICEFPDPPVIVRDITNAQMVVIATFDGFGFTKIANEFWARTGYYVGTSIYCVGNLEFLLHRNENGKPRLLPYPRIAARLISWAKLVEKTSYGFKTP